MQNQILFNRNSHQNRSKWGPRFSAACSTELQRKLPALLGDESFQGALCWQHLPRNSKCKTILIDLRLCLGHRENSIEVPCTGTPICCDCKATEVHSGSLCSCTKNRKV